MGHLIFRLNLGFKPKLKPKFGLKPKLIRKIKWLNVLDRTSV